MRPWRGVRQSTYDQANPISRSKGRKGGGRKWNGRTYTVTVTEDGFEYGGKLYRSLTKVARLRAATCDVVTLADAATVLARPGPENGPDSL